MPPPTSAVSPQRRRDPEASISGWRSTCTCRDCEVSRAGVCPFGDPQDAHLLWIADEALQAPEPQGWEQRLDPKGGVYYYHPTTGMSLNQHPLDHHYQQFYMQMKAQYDAMYMNTKANPATPGGGGVGGEGSQGASSSAGGEGSAGGVAAGFVPLGEPQSGGEVKKKKGFFGFGKKTAGPTEEMYQLTVDLVRQQDGLGAS